jgi:Na+/proline symporter
MKIFNLVFCLLFIFSAGLQYNDPDPYLWMPIYLYGAVLCWLAFKNRFYPKAYLIGIIAYLVYAVIKIFEANGVIDWYKDHDSESLVQSMKATKPWIENTREFGGLLILIIVLLINYFYSRKMKTVSKS